MTPLIERQTIQMVEEICGHMYRAGYTVAAQDDELYFDLVERHPTEVAALLGMWRRNAPTLISATTQPKETSHV